MAYLYNVVLYRPLLNALVFFYQTIAFHDLGVAIIFVTFLVRLILYPLFHRSTRHQTMMQRLQPEIKKIAELHKHDKQKQGQALMDLYKEHGVNPVSGILLLAVQLPILIALYRIFLSAIGPQQLKDLYGFVSAPQSINPSSFFGLINLRQRSILMVGLAAAAQYFQGRTAMKLARHDGKLSQAEQMSRNMVFVGPLLTVVLFYNFPAAVSLYWCATSVFSVFQQIIINKQIENGKLGKLGKKTG